MCCCTCVVSTGLVSSNYSSLPSHFKMIDQFIMASVNRHLATIRRLLRLLPSLATAEYYGQPVLHWAAQYGQTEVIKVLQQQRADMDGIDLQDATTLIMAAAIGQTATVRCVLSLGGNVNYQNTTGRTALIFACQNGHVDFVISLLKAKASMYLHTCMDGFFPIHVAAQLNRPLVVKTLLDYGCAINLVSRDITKVAFKC